jgi:hypothetical protein
MGITCQYVYISVWSEFGQLFFEVVVIETLAERESPLRRPPGTLGAAVSDRISDAPNK